MNFLKSLLWIVLLIFPIYSQDIITSRAAETKTILILFGLSPSTPAYQPILNGIRLKLNEAFGDDYILHMEFLETERYSVNNYPKPIFDSYNDKYRSINLDLLICVGRNVIKPIKDNADKYLLNLPTIAFDLDYSRYGIESDLKLNSQTLSIGLKFNIEKTLSKSLDLFPEVYSLYLITGISDFDKLMLSISLAAAKKIDRIKKTKILTDLSMDEILMEVRRIPRNSLIVIPVYIKDSRSVPYYNTEAIFLISREASAPVISLSDMGMGQGSLGGYILSFKKAGIFTGKAAVDILNGADPNSITVSEDDFYESVYDWRELKKWNLESSSFIPNESTILFEPNDPIERFKWVIGAALLFLVLQSLLIANLIRLNRNQKTLTKKIIETENKYREFLHEDRGLRLGQIAASLSHELNQPLTAILSTAQAGINFINSHEANNELLKQILQKIVDNDKRTASVLNSLRGMLKLEKREKEKVSLTRLLEEVISVVKSEASKRDIKLNTEFLNDQINIIADKVQIQQVFLNIIFNAIQSIDKNENGKGEILINCFIKNDQAIVSVSDNGTGINDEIRERLFKPFASSKSEGLGIGLSICKTIIDDHQGKIWAENLPEGGAKFSFSLNVLNDDQRQQ